MKRGTGRSASASRGETAWPGSAIDWTLAQVGRLTGRWRALWLAAVVVLAALAVASARVHHGRIPFVLAVVGALAATAPLVAVRRWPLAALGLVVLANGTYVGATLGAVPQRRAMLAAKGLVFAAATLIAGEIMSFAAFTLGQVLLSGADAGASLGQAGVLRATVGGGLYLTAVGLLGFGLGALIRHTAGALSAFFGILFALRGLVDILPSSWQAGVSKFMPPNAGSQILTVIRGHDTLPPWVGLGVQPVLRRGDNRRRHAHRSPGRLTSARPLSRRVRTRP